MTRAYGCKEDNMNQKMKDILRPTIKELRDMIFMLRKNALTMAAVIALILILVIALLAPVIVCLCVIKKQ